MVFFWACEVTETKAAVVKVPENFVLNVCNATLATSSSSADQVLSVGVETHLMERKPWKGVVCHLGGAAMVHQYKLDLVFGAGAAQVKFFLAKGAGKVNLSGYFQPGPPADLMDNEMMQLEVVPNEEPAKDHNKKPTEQTKASKKRPREEAPAAPKQTEVTWDQSPSDDDEDDNEDEDNEEEEVKKTPTKKSLANNNTASSTPTSSKSNQTQTTLTAPNQTNSGSSKKKNKKRRKKNKAGTKDSN